MTGIAEQRPQERNANNKMNIETKFSIGQKVWICPEGTPVHAPVHSVLYFSAEGDKPARNAYQFLRFDPQVAEAFGQNNDPVTFEESACFATREELIASL